MTDEDRMRLARGLQGIARGLADRQNSPSTLSEKECTHIVNTCLSAGNVLEQDVRDRAAAAAPPGGGDDPGAAGQDRDRP